jgi:hypothetical protein
MARQENKTLKIKSAGQRKSLTSRVIGKGKKLFIPKKKEQIVEDAYKDKTINKFERVQIKEKRDTRSCSRPKLKSKNKHKLALRLLEKEFPKVFNLASPRPLSIGIREELIAANKSISNKQIRLGLFFYCNSHQYLKSVKEGTHRVNSTGRFVKKVTKEEETESIKRLRALFTKIKKSR